MKHVRTTESRSATVSAKAWVCYHLWLDEKTQCMIRRKYPSVGGAGSCPLFSLKDNILVSLWYFTMILCGIILNAEKGWWDGGYCDLTAILGLQKPIDQISHSKRWGLNTNIYPGCTKNLIQGPAAVARCSISPFRTQMRIYFPLMSFELFTIQTIVTQVSNVFQGGPNLFFKRQPVFVVIYCSYYMKKNSIENFRTQYNLKPSWINNWQSR